MITHIIIALFSLAILWSLFSALYIIGKRGFGQEGTVRALAWRIGLSMALFFFLLIGAWMGWIHPHLIAVAPPGVR